VATLSGAFTYEIPWGQIAAGVIAGSAPLIILLGIFQRRIVAGLTAGAVK
jgi:trehalose/maltose transport system permease protein